MDIVTYALLKKQVGNVSKQIEGLSEGMTFKGSVPTEADLPSNPQGGDLYIIQDTGTKVVWDSSNNEWIKFDNSSGGSVEPLDKSIVVKDGKVGVLISLKYNNKLRLESDGLFADSDEISEDELAVKLPGALQKSLNLQPDKNSGLIVENGNIKLNVNPDELRVVNNKLEFAFDVIQSN